MKGPDVIDINVPSQSSHDLARLLLTMPDKLVATHANNHTFKADTDFGGWGTLKVRETDNHIVIGNMIEPWKRTD